METYEDKIDMKFWARVEQRGPDDCWEWKGAKNRKGYGLFWLGDRSVAAHRYAYAYKYQREVPYDRVVCHHCDNPSCCNPNHLFLGTQTDNMHDKISKGRTYVNINERLNKPSIEDMYLLVDKLTKR